MLTEEKHGKLSVKEVRDERDFMNAASSLARANPESVHFLCTDYMTPLMLPHLPSPPKSLQTVQRPKYHVLGLVDASFSERYYSTHWEHYPNDCNYHLSALFIHLRNLRESGKTASKLVINTDNCAKDNKNIYVFAFFAFLVSIEWYKEVEWHSLQPGHSHYLADRDCFAPI